MELDSFIKTSNIQMSKYNNEIRIKNLSNRSVKVLCLKSIVPTEKSLLIDNTIKQLNGTIKFILCNKKKEILEEYDINSCTYINNTQNEVKYFGLLMDANSECTIEKIDCESFNIDEFISKYLEKDKIKIVNNINSLNGTKKEEIFIVNDDYINKMIFDKERHIIYAGYGIMRDILLRKEYKKITIDSLSIPYLKILDAIDKEKTIIEINNSDKSIIDRNITNFYDNDCEITIPTQEDKPLLTISIAAYNVSLYIIQTLTSLLKSKYKEKLEILVINDGSKDDTVLKVNDFIDRYYTEGKQPIIKVIDKKNGGHGSTINKGIEMATGKYFRLLDGDDYFITENFDKYIEKLLIEDSDLVLTDYIEDYADTGKIVEKKLYNNYQPYIKYNLNNFDDNEKFKDWGPLLSTTTIKTELLKNAPFKIDENCYYVDMEYNLLNYMLADSFTYYPLNIYNYYLGRSGQSVAMNSYIKNIKQHEKVCISIVSNYYKHKDNLSQTKRKYVENRMIMLMCRTQYELTMFKFKSRENFNSFDKKLKKYVEIYKDKRIAGVQVRFHRLTRGIFIIFNPLIQAIRKQLKKQ